MKKLNEIQRIQLRIDCNDEEAAKILELVNAANAAGFNGEAFIGQLARIQTVERSARALIEMGGLEVRDDR